MAEVAQAWVTIIPSMKGSQEKIAKELGAASDKAGDQSGDSFVKSLVGKVKAIGVGAAVAKVLGDTLSAGADLQQSLGGIETMFKENADIVKGYASEAYKTAGVSANDYMESVTSFSAALISSMDGDTAAAAEMANTAMIDMADNANKMGTDMQSIQNAYQGFAKGQYTMLDNLKLGYGGTKTEMERLLADASELSGVKYDISNLNDVYSAIHVIQENLGITGTTAKEASETFSGSFASMKAAAEDLMGNLALGNDITPMIHNLGDAVSTFVTGNLLPMVGNIVQEIPTIIGQLPGFLAGILPELVGQGAEIVAGLAGSLIENIPVFVEGLGELVTQGIDALINADWSGAGETIVGLLESAWGAMTETAQTIWNTVVDIFTSVIEAVPILSEAWDALSGVAEGIWETVTGIFTGEISVIDIISSAWDGLTGIAQGIWDAIVEIFTGEISVVDVLTSAWDGITGIAEGIWESVTGVFTGEISVLDILTSAWDGLTGIAQGIWDAIVEIFTGSIDVAGIATGAWDTLSETAQGIWDAAKGIFEGAAPTVKGVVATAWNSLVDTAGSIWKAAKGKFEKAGPKVKAVVADAWQNLQTAADTAWTNAKNAFESVAPKVKAVATDAWDTLTSTAETIWGEVKGIFGSFEITWPDFGELASSAFEGLKTAAQTAWEWVKGLFGGGSNDETVEAVHGSTQEMEAALAECSLVVADVDTSSLEQANSEFETVANHWELVVSDLDLTLPTVDCTAIGTAMSIVEQGAAAMQSAMNFSWSLPALHGTVPSISVSMQSASSSDGKTTVSYPVFNVGTKWFAEGAIFNQPTVIGVGEAGAEAALPLDTFWKKLDAEFEQNGSGATINNYIEINGATDPVAYADELARELQQQLKRGA